MKPFIVSVNSGFFDIYDNKKIIRVKARGNLRNKIKPLAGDFVEYDDKGTLEKILPRDNFLIRPPIANIDQALIIVSLTAPAISLDLIARYILSVELRGIKPIIILTKVDLISTEAATTLQRFYQDIGYQTYLFSTKTTIYHEQIKALINDNKSVLIGQSGVGKSSLVNALWPQFNLNTNAISSALGRGKHTTRIVSFFNVGTGFLADTPGFSLFDFSKIAEAELATFYPGFKQYIGQCRFRSCLHKDEPCCMIKEKFCSGIYQEHYQNYLKIIKESKKIWQ